MEDFAEYARGDPLVQAGRLRRANAETLARDAAAAAECVQECFSDQDEYLGSPPGHGREFEAAVHSLRNVVTTATAVALNLAGAGAGKTPGAFAAVEAVAVAAVRILTNLGADAPLGGAENSALLGDLDRAIAGLMSPRA